MSLKRAWSGMRRLFVLAAGVVGVGTLGVAAAVPGTASATSTCNLGHGVHHVVILQFDNVHSERDNPSVPSDLEQMPALRNFLTSNGTLLTNDHTVLISHTSNGIVSTETGLYPDRNGVTVGNSYQYFDPTAPTSGNVGGSDFTSAFKYWTDPVATNGSDSTFNNDTSGNGGNTNTPAPWVPFTRAGCDFAGLGAANMELENTSSDVATRRSPAVTLPAGSRRPRTSRGSRSTARSPTARPAAFAPTARPTRSRPSPAATPASRALFGAFQVNPCSRPRDVHRRVPGAEHDAGVSTCSRRTRPTPPRPTSRAPTTVTNLPADGAGKQPPDTFTGGTTDTSQLIRTAPATRASPASTARRPTTRSARRPPRRRPGFRSPTRTSRTSTTTTTTRTTATRSAPARPATSPSSRSTTRRSPRSSSG